jgi:enamine deaminase RidA (YjgF/YER057c/UK114 family)
MRSQDNFKPVGAERPWAELIAYSRATRRGCQIEVGGTTATNAAGEALYPGDAYEQTKHALAVMIAAIEELGGTRNDVVRTRAFLTNIGDWEAAGRAHGEIFRGIDPASTFVEVSALLLPGLVVEMEATAILPSESGSW